MSQTSPKTVNNPARARQQKILAWSPPSFANRYNASLDVDRILMDAELSRSIGNADTDANVLREKLIEAYERIEELGDKEDDQDELREEIRQLESDKEELAQQVKEHDCGLVFFERHKGAACRRANDIDPPCTLCTLCGKERELDEARAASVSDPGTPEAIAKLETELAAVRAEAGTLRLSVEALKRERDELSARLLVAPLEARPVSADEAADLRSQIASLRDSLGVAAGQYAEKEEALLRRARDAESEAAELRARLEEATAQPTQAAEEPAKEAKKKARRKPADQKERGPLFAIFEQASGIALAPSALPASRRRGRPRKERA